MRPWLTKELISGPLLGLIGQRNWNSIAKTAMGKQDRSVTLECNRTASVVECSTSFLVQLCKHIEVDLSLKTVSHIDRVAIQEVLKQLLCLIMGGKKNIMALTLYS